MATKFLLACVLAVLACVASAAEFNYFIHNNPPAGSPLGIIGNVNDVLAGNLKPGVNTTWYDAKDFRFGFGAASPHSIYSFGESFFTGGMAYTLSTDHNYHFYEPIHGRFFLTMFSIGIRKHDDADLSVSFEKDPNSSEVVTLQSLYQNIYNRVEGRPFCFHGLVHYSTLKSLAVSKPPIYGESLIGADRAKYYTEPMLVVNDQNSVTMGCAANFSNVDAALQEGLSKALYVNPLDPASATGLQVHAHGVSVDNTVTRLKDVNPNTVTNVHHMVTDSEIKSFNIQVFVINGVTTLPVEQGHGHQDNEHH
eukprot:GEZU01038761.1.p2 GENE.GEZU01038761.1~~GEZU01038761.1.p2  ORF type:complete len:317 (+),score=132.20 GEZU01038761.1:26-952(+)